MKRWSYTQVSPLAINGQEILEELDELERLCQDILSQQNSTSTSATTTAGGLINYNSPQYMHRQQRKRDRNFDVCWH